jgi:hypothetical protein
MKYHIGVSNMATESIFRTIKIETPEEISRFAEALEQAEEVATEPVDTSELFSVATRDDLSVMFGGA